MTARIEMNFEIESDGNLIWQAGADCRVVITRMQLYVPRETFNSEGQSSYMSQYLKNHKWTYLRENIERSNSSRQRAGHFRISTGISKPRHVFVFIINDATIDAQTANPFLYNTFSVSTYPIVTWKSETVTNTPRYITHQLLIWPESLGMCWNMFTKIMNTVRGHYLINLILVSCFHSYIST